MAVEKSYTKPLNARLCLSDPSGHNPDLTITHPPDESDGSLKRRDSSPGPITLHCFTHSPHGLHLAQKRLLPQDDV